MNSVKTRLGGSSHLVQVPPQAFDLSFAFTDGHGEWDNNDGHNYSLPVWQPQQQQQQQQQQAPLRSIASVEVGVIVLPFEEEV